jgi:hypothetical protein
MIRKNSQSIKKQNFYHQNIKVLLRCQFCYRVCYDTYLRRDIDQKLVWVLLFSGLYVIAS